MSYLPLVPQLDGADFAVLVFLMLFSGILLIAMAATRKAKTRQIIAVCLLIPWVVFAGYNLFSLA